MDRSVSRRTILKAGVGTSAAWALSAASYAKVKGANDRIAIAQIGCGDRGTNAHMIQGIGPFAQEQNIEVTAVCDPWRLRQEAASAAAEKTYGRPARKFSSYRDVMALKDIDAVMIASPDVHHTTHLKAAALAGKDAYCEKPLAMDFNKLKDTVDAVKKANIVVQIGTQLRSMSSFTGCRELYKTGILGTVGRIEQCRNNEKPYWYNYVKDVKPEDVDWKEFLGDRPFQPFDSVKYSGWYGYRETSDGPVCGYGSHYLDLVHYITGAKFPTSSVCLGGTYTYNDEHHFTCPDHVQAMWTYPEGFMVSYSTYCGNDSANSFKILGNEGVLDMISWTDPVLSAEGGAKRSGKIRGKIPVKKVETPDHFLNWLQCLRSRQTPNASIDAGYQHAVACLMAVQSFDKGKRMIYDVEKREIREG
ncbi:MAG: Gfo/Idh/MocA family oxidoreductase [Planctomycetes bacterium]|nr:Gfo/Idh/MocA family oxidoreductase [Planctomycetota bacterium]